MSKTLTIKLHKSILKICCAILLISTAASADCQYQLFNITTANHAKIRTVINQLSQDCQFTLVVRSKYASHKLNQRLNQTYIKNMTLDEVFNLILSDHNLFYTFKNNTLTISYLKTKTFNINYILSQRKGTGSTDITLGSNNSNNSNGGLLGSTQSSATNSNSQSQSATSQTSSGISITSTDEVEFWKNLDTQLRGVLNRPEDSYTAQSPIINKNAGLITVTATKNQLDRLGTYLKRLQKKVQLQVLINVQLLTVTMSQSKTTGIDWSQLYALENGTIHLNYISKNNVTTWDNTNGDITTIGDQAKSAANLITIKAGGTINQIIKFLKTQGNVQSISNPKILTLNNQPALITSGTQYFYTIKQSANQQGSSGGIASTVQNNIVRSVFAGILLNITPEISDNNMVTLKINPSISETADGPVTTTSATRTAPPDLNKRQLSSVVTVKSGNRIILGGLIHTVTTVDNNKVPILGDIPGLSYLFSRKSHSKEVQELVIIIQPHIIRNGESKLSLSDLGYEVIKKSMLRKSNDLNLTIKADKEGHAKQ